MGDPNDWTSVSVMVMLRVQLLAREEPPPAGGFATPIVWKNASGNSRPAGCATLVNGCGNLF
jgi:hypothetical protein